MMKILLGLLGLTLTAIAVLVWWPPEAPPPRRIAATIEGKAVDTGKCERGLTKAESGARSGEIEDVREGSVMARQACPAHIWSEVAATSCLWAGVGCEDLPR